MLKISRNNNDNSRFVHEVPFETQVALKQLKTTQNKTNCTFEYNYKNTNFLHFALCTVNLLTV